MQATNILILEQDKKSLRNIQEALYGLAQLNLMIASTEDTAMRSARSQKLDLIIAETKLKGKKDGIDIVKQINQYYPVPVIYISSEADANVFERAKQTPLVNYIIKPFKTCELEFAVELALSTTFQLNR